MRSGPSESAARYYHRLASRTKHYLWSRLGYGQADDCAYDSTAVLAWPEIRREMERKQ